MVADLVTHLVADLVADLVTVAPNGDDFGN
jgi:hypothetical protein